MKTTISTNGRMVLPAELRRQDHIEAGQRFRIERLGCGDDRLKRCGATSNDGVVDWLLACPEKGYFVPVDDEPTDTP